MKRANFQAITGGWQEPDTKLSNQAEAQDNLIMRRLHTAWVKHVQEYKSDSIPFKEKSKRIMRADRDRFKKQAQ